MCLGEFRKAIIGDQNTKNLSAYLLHRFSLAFFSLSSKKVCPFFSCFNISSQE